MNRYSLSNIAKLIIISVFLINHLAQLPVCNEDKFIIINKNLSLDKVINILKNEDIDIDYYFTKIYFHLLPKSELPKFGEYQIIKSSSTLDILKIIRSGKQIIQTFNIPEGLTKHEIINIIKKDKRLLWNTDDSKIKEGTLFPSSYNFELWEKSQNIINQMQQKHEYIFNNLWESRKSSLPIKTKNEALILASIVQKEVGRKDDINKIASVLINRIRTKMRIQSDPTLIYGITNGLGSLERELTKKDLKTPSTYNTYIIRGLPPTPISNPGEAAMKSVLHAEPTDDFYFVSDNQGSHFFSKTLNEHIYNIKRYKEIKKYASENSD